MPAPKGNQHALGNKGGRPRTTGLSPEEMIELGEEMVAWVKEHKPLHISFWWRAQKHFSYNQWKSFEDFVEFRPYRDEAMGLIAENYINGNVNASIAHRFLPIYFSDVREQEREHLKYEADLKKEVTQYTNPEDQARHDALMKQIADLQQKFKT